MSRDTGGPIPIFTIGYGQRDLDALIDALHGHAIQFLIDVRSQPYSRFKPDFSKDALSARLEAAGIRYVFMGDTLGGRPDDPACYTNGKVDYQKLARQAFYQAGIQRLREAYRQQQRVVILCSEGKPEQCHRASLIGRTLADDAIPVAHIDEDGTLLSQAEVMARLQRGQPSLFGDEFFQFKSRKRYLQEEDED